MASVGKEDSANAGGTALPSYSDVRREPAPPHISANSSSANGKTEHVYSLNNAKGKAWLSLKLASRSPSAKALPLFLDGDVISGEVKVELDKPEGCKGVTVAIRAENTAVGQEPVPFVDISSTLWTPSPSSSKLSGTISWHFTLTLPKEAAVAEKEKGPTKNYPLPPTFTERASPAYIDYKIIVTVKRGAFKVNQSLSTSFAYVPRWVAPPPSALRRLAYSDGSYLIGPEGDPDGWKILAPVKFAGTLFDAKSIEVEATLAIATPLSYATGSPIPLLLTIKSSDTQALDLFSQASSTSVYLTRTIAIGSEATNESAPRRSNNTFPENVGKAFWWPSEEGAPEAGKRVLHGEIEVGKGLKPGFVFPRFTIRYHVSLMSFTAPGFSSPAPTDQPLLSEKVSIVTENAPGVIPRSHAPPGYVKPEEGNYNNSMGYLENGNQRFYHHHGWS